MRYFSLLERLNGKADIYRHLETPHFNLPNNDYQRGWNEAMLFIHERYGKQLDARDPRCVDHPSEETD